jgi:hypothetical protein
MKNDHLPTAVEQVIDPKYIPHGYDTSTFVDSWKQYTFFKAPFIVVFDECYDFDFKRNLITKSEQIRLHKKLERRVLDLHNLKRVKGNVIRKVKN